MKPIKSIVFLTAGVLSVSACDAKKDQQTAVGTGTAVESEQTTDAASPGYTHKMDDASSEDAEMGTGTGQNMDESDFDTSEGSGAVSDEAMSDEMEVQEEEERENMELIDETSSEPDVGPTGEGPRLVPKYKGIDNTSSEPDPNQIE